MKLIKFSTIALISLFLMSRVSAGTVGIGSDAWVATDPCRFTFSGSCNIVPTPGRGDMGLKYQSYSGVGVIDSLLNFYGSAYASAILDDRLLLPQLKAYALDAGVAPPLTNPDPSRYTGETATYTEALVWAVGHYAYTGNHSTRFSLTGRFTSVFDLSPESTAHSMMRIGVFNSDTYRFDVDGICPIGLCNSSATALGNLSVNLTKNSPHQELTVFFDVAPGDEFYVGGYLDAVVCCHGMVDSSHTMDMMFNDISMLEMLPVPGAPAVSVDEPSAILLFSLGLFSLFAFRPVQMFRQREFKLFSRD